MKRSLKRNRGHYEKRLLTYAGENSFVIPVLNGDQDFIKCKNLDDLYAVIEKDNVNITSVVEMKQFYYAPIIQGETLGKVIYYNNGTKIGQTSIIADYNIDEIEYEFNLWDWIKNLWKK